MLRSSKSFGRSICPEDKAIKAATALSASLSKVEDETAKSLSRQDFDIDAIRKGVTTLEVDNAVLKWMNGVCSRWSPPSC